MLDDFTRDYEPTRPVHPGEILAEEIEARGMSQVDLARRMGRPQQKISEILHGKRAITPETAIELSRVLGVAATLWNNLQTNYELDCARIRQKAALTAQARLLGRFPVAEMTGLQWVPSATGGPATVRGLLGFLGVASLKAWDEVCRATAARLSPTAGGRARSKRLSTATALWLRKGEIEAGGLALDEWSARQFRQSLSELASPATVRSARLVDRAAEVCARAGVALVVVPELQGLELTAVARWLSPRRPLIQLSARLVGTDRFLPALFHGACHILKHGKSRIHVEPCGSREDVDAWEAEARAFAAGRTAALRGCRAGGGGVKGHRMRRAAKRAA